MSGPQEALTAPESRQPDLLANQSRPLGPPVSPFNLGPVNLRPHLLYRYLHATGLPVSQGLQVATEINTFAPGLLLDIGQHWAVDYTPTWTYYTTPTMRDTHDHALSVRGATSYEDWGFEFSENYAKSSPTLIETAQQTDQVTWATRLGATYKYGANVTIQTIASLNELYTDISPDTRDWESMNWLTLQFNPQVEGALGLGLGYVDVVGSADLKYQQYLGRLNWHLSDKLKLGIQGGMDVRHSESASIGNVRNPLLQASLEYQLLDTTKLTLADARTVANSYFRDEVTDSSQWSVSLEQRLLGRLFLNTSYSHQRTSYTSVTTTTLSGRSDRVEAFNARLTLQLLRRLTIATVYQSSRNHSSLAGYNYSGTQYGLELGCRY